MSTQWPKSCAIKILDVNKCEKKYTVEKKFKNSICDKTKKNKKKVGHNLKTQNVMQLKNLSCERKKTLNLDYDKN